MPKKIDVSGECINHELVEMLLEIGNYERNVNKQIHKYNAYRKAAKSIETYDKKITTIEEAMALEGVGKKIAEKIGEFLNKGRISKFDQVHSSEEANVIGVLMSVSGIGPSAARKLYDKGARSVNDLNKFMNELTHHQQVGLRYYDDLTQRIPRAEMVEIEQFVIDEVRRVDSKFKVEAVGSYRRGAESSGDIDFLLTHQSFPESSKSSNPKKLFDSIIDRLNAIGFLTDTMACGSTKFMVSHLHEYYTLHPEKGVCILKGYSTHRRIDIRTKCLERGFTLNEYSIRKIGLTGEPGEKLPIHSEKDIFDYVGEKFLRPSERK